METIDHRLKLRCTLSIADAWGHELQVTPRLRRDITKDIAFMLSCLQVLLYGAALINLGQGLSPISVKGTKLYNEDGTQFFVKGVYYSKLCVDGSH